jgi:dTDP-glucose 4,6-dehydratase
VPTAFEGVLKNTDWDIVILDRLDISGNLERLRDIDIWEKEKNRIKFLFWDLKAEVNQFIEKEIGQVDYIIHLAASTHVDRSITDPMSFVMDNVVGTTNLLNFARKQNNLKAFINFSTDEVFGPAPAGYSNKETDPHRPSNPYAASKAGAIDMGFAYFVTYKVPVITTHTMNNFGERQTPEKLIPKCIRMVQEQKPMPIFAEWDKETGKMKAVGSRFWIHSREVADAILFLLDKGIAGEFYNIIGSDELTNLEICEMVAKAVGKPLIPDFVDWHSSRPGHDIRYALSGEKLNSLGWKPKMPIETSLDKTVKWTLNNPKWL